MRTWRLKKHLYQLVESGWRGVPGVLQNAVAAAENVGGMTSRAVDTVRGLRPDVSLPSHTRVLCVGGVSWGGDGKTPLARYMARRLRDRGNHVAMVIRSYGGRTSRPQRVPPGELLARRPDVRTFGDEAVMLSGTLKGIDVWAGHRRASVARAARTGPDVIIVDDGLSLRGVRKDLEIALLSSDRLVHRTLPAGPLRRPITDTSEADIVGIRVPDAALEPEEIEGRVSDLLAAADAREHPWFCFRLAPVERGNGIRVHLASGIANSARFEQSANEAGYQVVGSTFYPDHHFPSKYDFTELTSLARLQRAESILVTAKDAPRFTESLDGIPVRVLTSRVKILSNREVMDSALERIGRQR